MPIFRRLYPYLKLRYHFGGCKTFFKILDQYRNQVGWLDLEDQTMMFPRDIITKDYQFQTVTIDNYLEANPEASPQKAEEFTKNLLLVLDRMTLKHVHKNPHQFTMIAETSWCHKFLIKLDASAYTLKISNATYILEFEPLN